MKTKKRVLIVPPRENGKSKGEGGDARMARKGRPNTAQIIRARDDRPSIMDSGIKERQRAENRFPTHEQSVSIARKADSDSLYDDERADQSIIEPPYDPLELIMMTEESNGLGPLVEVMVNNVDGFGWRLDTILTEAQIASAPEKVREEIKAEWRRLMNFFNNVYPDYTFQELRLRTRRDLESVGDAYWEVIRNALNLGTGAIVSFKHVSCHRIRIARLSKKEITFRWLKTMFKDDGSVGIESVECRKKFRRFAQMDESGTKPIRWFREFGDPHSMNYETGVYGTESEPVPSDKQATELFHFNLYSGRSPYGVPRYSGNIMSVLADDSADMINFSTLENNNVPSMAVTVSNGYLTEESVERIQEFVDETIRGGSNLSRWLILEADTGFEGADSGVPKIEIKPLTDSQMRDQMFVEYGKNNQNRIRRSFRIPSMFVGDSGDLTRAIATAVRAMADEQVFAPIRRGFDDMINQRLMPHFGAVHHKLRTHGPNVTDNNTIVNLISAAERSGAMTPALALQLISDIMGEGFSIPSTSKLDPNIPFSLQLAEAVKNTAPVGVGSQVTALKRLAKVSPKTSEWIGKIVAMRHEIQEALIARGFEPEPSQAEDDDETET